MSSRKNTSCSDNHVDQTVQEDGPEYRSVMMMRPLVTPMPRSFAPLPSKVAPTTTSSTKTTLSGSQWKVHELTALPAGYLLERTNVYVDASAQVVADRICNFLRTQSIAVDSKSSEDDENVLKAETKDCLKFAVRLFSDNGMVVVEVQRLTGCSFSYKETSRAVLRTAKGMHPMPPQKRFTIPSTVPQRSRDVHDKCIQDDFDIAYNMLKSNRSDSQVLALESMEQMTRSCVAIDVAAKSVLSCHCLKQLFALLEEQNNMDIAMEGRQSSILRRKILAVLANACTAISQADLADILSSNENDLKTRSFLSLLLTTLRDASRRPHDAYEAARCLKSLLVSKEVQDAVIEMSAIEVVSSACSAGCNSHEALEKESNKLIVQLRNSC